MRKGGVRGVRQVLLGLIQALERCLMGWQLHACIKKHESYLPLGLSSIMRQLNAWQVRMNE